MQYFVGAFDGRQFSVDPSTPVEKALWLDCGSDFYAGVTWSDIPESDGRRIMIGWMSNWNYARDIPTSPWRGVAMPSLALTLRRLMDPMECLLLFLIPSFFSYFHCLSFPFTLFHSFSRVISFSCSKG